MMRSGPGWNRRCATAVVAVVCALNSVPPLRAQDARPTDLQVKAAYLSKFGKFVDWPASARSASEDRFNICILGQDPFGSILDNAVQGDTIGKTPLAARRITKVEDASPCRVVFVASSEAAQLKPVVAALETLNVLTVSDLPDFTRRGGAIQFVMEGNRVHFEVNLAAARRAGLNLSSDLLKLAVATRKGP